MESPNKTVIENREKKIEKLIFNEKEFISFVDYCREEGLITDKIKNEIIHSLQKLDVKDRLKLWMKVSSIVSTTSFLMALVVGGMAVSVRVHEIFKVYVFLEILTSIGKNIFIRHHGKGLSDKNKLGNYSMIPFVGDWSIPLSLYKNHPELVKFFLYYLASRKKFKKKQKIDVFSPKYQIIRYRIRRDFEWIKNKIKILSKIRSVLSFKKKSSLITRKKYSIEQEEKPLSNTFMDFEAY